LVSSSNRNRSFILSLVNVGRAFINPFFIALVSYLFIKLENKDGLFQINRLIVYANAVLVFAGWGLKDYLTRVYSTNSKDFPKKWSMALYSKCFLLLISFLLLGFLFKDNDLLILTGFIFIRTLNQHFEVLMQFDKRNMGIMAIELTLILFILLAISFGKIQGSFNFFIGLIISEAIKLAINIIVFRMPLPQFKWKEIYDLLNETKFFFLASIVGFFQSKADLYILAGSVKQHDLNEYQVITSLISLAYITIFAFTAYYSKLLFRSIYNSNRTFLYLNMITGLITAITFSAGIYVVLQFVYNFALSKTEFILVITNIFIFSIMLVEMYHYNKLNRVGQSTLIIFIAGVINLMVGSVLIGKYSVLGAIISNTGSLLILTITLFLVRISDKKIAQK